MMFTQWEYTAIADGSVSVNAGWMSGRTDSSVDTVSVKK